MIEDQKLICKDCGKEFVFSASEQDFFAQKGFKNIPTRCQDCRKNAREERRKSQVVAKVRCVACGKEAEVNFEPKGKPLYCSACFAKIQK